MGRGAEREARGGEGHEPRRRRPRHHPHRFSGLLRRREAAANLLGSVVPEVRGQQSRNDHPVRDEGGCEEQLQSLHVARQARRATETSRASRTNAPRCGRRPVVRRTGRHERAWQTRGNTACACSCEKRVARTGGEANIAGWRAHDRTTVAGDIATRGRREGRNRSKNARARWFSREHQPVDSPCRRTRASCRACSQRQRRACEPQPLALEARRQHRAR
ncbi:MAG: hypothetical protein JWO36_3578 [Myxococcales bacterium]|nr:hypothetical protein [Myxococcales bacterium]